MIEAEKQVTQLELVVERRLRLLAIQDLIALSLVLSSGMAVIVLAVLRLGLFEARIDRGIGSRDRLLLWSVPVAAAAVLLLIRQMLGKRGRWRSSLIANADQADLIIDRTLSLEDRARAAGSVIRSGGPTSAMEGALVEDAASKLAGANPNQVVRYRPPRLKSAIRCHSSVAWAVVLTLIAVVAAIQLRLPIEGTQTLDPTTIAVMEAVGDDLEKSTRALEGPVDESSPTAALAREQAELGRTLKEAASGRGRVRGKTVSRPEALKQLSAIEEKLKSRESELSTTRASEIVNLAERRFESALSGSSARRHPPAQQQREDIRSALDKRGGGSNKPGTNKQDTGDNDGDKARLQGEAETTGEQAASVRHDQANRDSGAPAAATRAREATTEPEGVPQQAVDQSAPANSKGGEQQSEGSLQAGKQDGPAAPPEKEAGSSTAAGAIPNLSQDLLKKAAEMKANNLTPGDVEQLRKAAEGLLKDLSVKDLANLANSKEIQQTLEQLARQVNPQQLEQLARQLLSQKEIRDELQAVGKLLLQNRQAKETIAGFTDKAREIAEQFRRQGFGPGTLPSESGRSGAFSGQSRPGVGNQSGSPQASKNYSGRGSGAEAIQSKGRQGETGKGRVRGEFTAVPNSEGEPIYGRARPGTAPARVPYTTAYPGYRREAERSVERSQVPVRLRSLVRNYFDAINPDAERQR